MDTNTAVSKKQAQKILNSELRSEVKTKLDLSVVNVDVQKNNHLTINYITYKVGNTTFNNLAIVKGKGIIKVKGVAYHISPSDKDENEGTVIKCIGDCTNRSGSCAMKGSHDPGTSTSTLECTCEGCQMIIKR